MRRRCLVSPPLRVEPFHRLHQTNISLRDQVEKRQPEIRVVMRDFDDQAQVGPNHQRSRFAIALFNLSGQLDLLIRRQQRDLPDLAQGKS